MSKAPKKSEQNVEGKQPTCGLIMPISMNDGLPPSHWEQVRDIITEALNDTIFQVRLVSDSDAVGLIHKNIIQNIFLDDIVICDVSTKNANVMFELGMRLAFDKPTVIIKDDETEYAFDTQVIRHIGYKRSLRYHDIITFKERLKSVVQATYEASLVEGYSTFLNNFKIENVQSLETIDVTSSQYFIDSINNIGNSLARIENRVELLESPRDPFAKSYSGKSIENVIYNFSSISEDQFKSYAGELAYGSTASERLKQHHRAGDFESRRMDVINFVAQCLRAQYGTKLRLNDATRIVREIASLYENLGYDR